MTDTFLETARASRSVKGPRCSVSVAVDRFASDDPTILAALGDLSIEHTAISRAFRTRYDVRLTPDSIRRHRRGDCSCGRAA